MLRQFEFSPAVTLRLPMVKRKRIGSGASLEQKEHSTGMTIEVRPSAENRCLQKSDGPDATLDKSSPSPSTFPCSSRPSHPRCSRTTQPLTEIASGQSENTAVSGKSAEHSAGDGGIPSAEESDVGSGGDPSHLTISGPTLRSSARVQKKLREDRSPECGPEPTNNGTGSSKARNSPEQGKARRSWELWSVEDKDTFFEALCEYGKDFENIQTHIVQKNRKKGYPPHVMKNKNQVRHFYYRTWHKISKHLEISDDVKKQAQELYGLINYGELRKKLGGGLDEKNGQKLNELVLKGATTIRCRGKNLRIKTPVCRALKKLNDVEDPKIDEHPKLQSKILLEVRPRNNRSWTHVQSVAQNPRVRVTVSLQCRMSAIINHLQEKWKSASRKQREQLLKMSPELENGIAEAAAESVLRLTPLKCDSVCTVSVKPTKDVSSTSVSLENYRRRVLCLGEATESANETCCRKGAKGRVGKAGCGSATSEETKKGSGGGGGGSSEGAVSKSTTTDVSTRPRLLSDDDKMEEPGKPPLNHGEDSCSVPAHEVTLRHLLALETAVDPRVSSPNGSLFPRAPSFLCDTQQAASTVSDPIVSDEKGSLAADTKLCDMNEDNKKNRVVSEPGVSADLADVLVTTPEKQLESIKRGWTLKDVDTLTVGEVYLMLGSPSRLVLQYEWETAERTTDCLAERASKPVPFQQLTSTLGKLLTVASSTFTDLIKVRQGAMSLQPCRCGHHCCSATLLPTKTVSAKASNARTPTTWRAGGISGNVKPSKTSAIGSKGSGVPSTSDGPLSNDVKDAITSKGFCAAAPVFRIPIGLSQKNVSKSPNVGSQTEKVMPCDQALKEQLDKFAQHRKGKGRFKKAFTPQRELPLLPKSGPHQPVVTLRLVPSTSPLAGSYIPVLPGTTVTSAGVGAIAQTNPLTKVIRLAPTAVVPSGTVAPIKPIVATSVVSAPKLTLTPIVTAIEVGAQPTIVTVTPSATATNSTNCSLLLNSDNTDHLMSSLNTSSLTTVASNDPPTRSTDPTLSDLVDYTLSTALKMTEATSSSVSDLPNLENRIGALSATTVVTSKTSNSSSIPEISIAETGSVSPPNISALLDISLSGTDAISGVDSVQQHLGSNVSVDKLLDITMGNSNSGFSALMSIPSREQRPSTPVTSPTNSLFKFSSSGLDGHWLNGDAPDFSLSNFLSHLESPVKASSTTTSVNQGESARDLDPNFQSLMMNENCIDYIAKFEDFAAQMSSRTDSPKKSM